MPEEVDIRLSGLYLQYSTPTTLGCVYPAVGSGQAMMLSLKLIGREALLARQEEEEAGIGLDERVCLSVT